MSKEVDRNKLVELAIKQNLLIWQLSKSFIELEKKIVASVKSSPQ